MKHREFRIMSCMYLLSLALLTAFALRGIRTPMTVSGELTSPHAVIVIDPGHGGIDGGAEGPDGTRESSLNLSISLRTDAVLALLGEETMLLRSTDTDLSSPEATTIAQKKVTDIHNRVSVVEQQASALLLSIHCNSYPDGKYHGAQVFSCPNGNSTALAELMQGAIRTNLDPSNRREAKPVSKDVYLMNHVSAPGVLIECGFLTNPEELNHLKNEDYQKKLSVIIAVTTSNFLSEDSSGV